MMTEAEIQAEIEHRVETRLGIQFEDREPTLRARVDAQIEAEEWAIQYRKENGIPEPKK